MYVCTVLSTAVLSGLEDTRKDIVKTWKSVYSYTYVYVRLNVRSFFCNVTRTSDRKSVLTVLFNTKWLSMYLRVPARNNNGKLK